MKGTAKSFGLVDNVSGYNVDFINLLKINIMSKLRFHRQWLDKSGLLKLDFAVENNILDLDTLQSPNLFGPPCFQDLNVLDFSLQVTHSMATLTN